MGPIKFGLLGASGKMGRSVVLVAERLNLQLKVHSREMGSGAKEALYQTSDVVIDFSSHESANGNVGLAERYSKPILIATTGHSDPTSLFSSKVPVLYAPNTCKEWAIIKSSVERLLSGNPNLEITVLDVHSASKKDSPSGTPKELLRAVGRESSNVTSIRKVDLASWHKVSLFEGKQVVTLEHQVLDREVYAAGAIHFATKLVGMPAGFYMVEDLLD